MTQLEIVQGHAGETLAGLSARTANELDLPTTAVLNDLFIAARLHEGQWIKLGRATAYVPQDAGQAPEDDAWVDEIGPKS